VDKLDSVLKHAFSRRSFLAGAGSVAAATAIAGCSSDAAPAAVSGYTDADILNFALNLEYLEASFYLYAATGSGLLASDMTAGSASPYQKVGSVTTSGNISVTALAGLTTAQQQIVNEIAYEEQEHVRFLRSALGSAAVPMPNIDLTFFSSLAVAAAIPGFTVSGSTAFSPFTSFNTFLLGSFIFEDVGVTAYAGAAPLISAKGVAAGYLDAAAGILAVEAYHAAYVRTTLTAAGIAAGSNTYIAIANQIEALRAELTIGNTSLASTETNLTLPSSSVSTPSASAIVAASASGAVGFNRTTSQVAHIVYGNPAVGTTSGGFFPSGLNSIFATAN